MESYWRLVLVIVALIPTLVVTGCYPSGAAEPATTVLLVRHADRSDGSLSEAGLERADKLAQVTLKAGVTSIYTTDTERTRGTAQPLVDLLGLEPLIYEVGSTDQIRELAEELLRDHTGEVVLVVGHNPTVPRTIDALGGDSSDCSIGTAYDEYDDLCIVTIYGPGKAKVVNIQYGKPSPSAWQAGKKSVDRIRGRGRSGPTSACGWRADGAPSCLIQTPN